MVLGILMVVMDGGCTDDHSLTRIGLYRSTTMASTVHER